MKKDQKLEIKKIQDKKEIEVVVQENTKVEDCKHDCSTYGKPSYYQSPKL